MSGLIAITDSNLKYLKCSWSLSLYIRLCLSISSKNLPWPSPKSHFCCKTPFCQKLPFSLFNCFQLQYFTLSTLLQALLQIRPPSTISFSWFEISRTLNKILSGLSVFNHQLDNSKPHEVKYFSTLYDIIRNNIMSLPFTHNIKCLSNTSLLTSLSTYFSGTNRFINLYKYQLHPRGRCIKEK